MRLQQLDHVDVERARNMLAHGWRPHRDPGFLAGAPSDRNAGGYHLVDASTWMAMCLIELASRVDLAPAAAGQLQHVDQGTRPPHA